MIWNPNGPDERPDIHEHRRQLLIYRGYFDDLAGFPEATQANILKRLRELADLTGEPMLAHDQTEALVRERDTARAEADALRASLTEARAVITRIATACATIDCEDLAGALTPDDYDDLGGHVEAVVSAGHALRAEVARLRPLRALFDHAIATDQFLTVEWHGPSSPNGATVYVDYAEIAEGGFDEAIAAACDRLGVSNG